MTKVLAVDPGEDTGFSIWQDGELLDGGTEKLWPFGDSVFIALFRPEEAELLNDELAQKIIGIDVIVCEDFRIYPWEAKKGTLNWDQVRTARLIGSLTMCARQAGIEFVLQGAKIKERAEAAGAKEYFFSPLTENRHLNDSILHFFYYNGIKNGATKINMQGEGPQDA